MGNKWWKQSVIYQIYPRSFMDSNGDGIGDLNGILSRLDYLKDLGIDVIWLSPVYESPNDDNGYDISDYEAIMKEFGTMDDWETLLDEVHRRGMRLIMDLVVNHSSDEHKWFIESRKSKDNPYRDYYIWRPGIDGGKPNNWASNFGGSAWKYDERSGEYYLHLFSEKQPDLNWENPTLRKEIYEMMKGWLEKGIDGFRMDVINFISKAEGLPDGEKKPGASLASGKEYYRNGPKIHEYLQEMNKEVLDAYDVMTVGEMPGVTPDLARLYTDEERNELNMVFQFEHVNLDSGPGGKWDLKKLDLDDLKWSLSRWQVALEDTGWNSLYFNNHDQPRSVSRFGDDSVYRKESAKMLATLLHMMKGTPYIYQGEEIGMTNVHFDTIDDYRDIETINAFKAMKENGVPESEIMRSIHAKSRDNARTPMQWDDGSNAGFTKGKPWIKLNPNYRDINVKEAIQDPDSIYHYYKKLIQLRKEYEVVVHGRFEMMLEDHPEIFAYTRTWKNETLLVLCNFYDGTPTVKLPESFASHSMELLLSNQQTDGNAQEIKLQPYEARIYLAKSIDA